MAIRTESLAFPTAIGAGAHSLGGSGGQVIHVTTLIWDAPGGLKEAIQTTGDRTIVFDVSGIIDATSESDYSTLINGSMYGNLTIAGQTAPQGGITIETSCFAFKNADNIICRYIRFRQGGGGSDQDALWMINCSNLIFDHCTFSHGNDEACSFSGSSGSMTNVTIQNCFIQDSKTGVILGVDGTNGDYTFAYNAISNVSHRFPNTKGQGRYDIINNVIYNHKARLSRFQEGGEQNLINNYYKLSDEGLRKSGWYGNGSTTNVQHKIAVNNNDTIPVVNYPVVYCSGSIITGEREVPQTDDSDTFTAFYGSDAADENDPVPSKYFTSTPYTLNGVGFPIRTALETYTDVLNDVGANKTLNGDGSINYYQDTKDAADILMIQNDTYSGAFYDSRSSIPMPVVPENSREAGYYNNSKDPDIPELWYDDNVTEGESSSDLAPSGYTWLEEYLNSVDISLTGNIPVITLIGNSSINLYQGDTYNDAGATANDIEDGDLTENIVVTGTTDGTVMNTPGIFYTYYNVTDSNTNNAIQVIRSIEVTETDNIEYSLTDKQKINSKNSIISLTKNNLI